MYAELQLGLDISRRTEGASSDTPPARSPQFMQNAAGRRQRNALRPLDSCEPKREHNRMSAEPEPIASAADDLEAAG